MKRTIKGREGNRKRERGRERKEDLLDFSRWFKIAEENIKKSE